MLLVLEARTARRETTRHNREVAFRAALVELATDVQLLESWQATTAVNAPRGLVEESPHVCDDERPFSPRLGARSFMGSHHDDPRQPRRVH